MTMVVKRDRSKEMFDEEKLRRSIESAAREAKLPEKKVKHLVDEVSEPVIGSMRSAKLVRTAAIREDILNKLDATEPDVSRAWRDFDARTKGVTC
jgi:transcriptional regulator NrdR family protein